MREPAQIMKDLAATGLSPDQLALVFELAQSTALEAAGGKPKTSGAARTARWRERHKASPNVTDVTVDETSHIVTNRHDVTVGDASRVRDITSTSEERLSPSSSSKRDDWPDMQPGDWAKSLAMMAGPGLADFHKTPRLIETSGEIARWRQCGFSWGLDVVPVIQARTAKPRGDPLTGWNVLTPDIAKAHARRTRPPEVVNLHERHHPNDRRKDAFRERLADIDAAMGAAVEQLPGGR